MSLKGIATKEDVGNSGETRRERRVEIGIWEGMVSGEKKKVRQRKASLPLWVFALKSPHSAALLGTGAGLRSFHVVASQGDYVGAAVESRKPRGGLGV